MIAPLTPQERDEALMLLRKAQDEDGRDVTSEAILPEGTRVEGRIVTRQACRVAGLPVAVLLCEDAGVSLEACVDEGAARAAGAAIARVMGDARSILGCERILLNFLGRLSGIATLTRRYVEAFHPTAIYDTRKTTPGWRLLDKYAVRVGGGVNHRISLEDQVLIKDNHLAALRHGGESQGLEQIVDRALRFREEHASRGTVPEDLRVEVEVDNEADFRAAVQAGADIVMLDNWATPAIRKALAWLREEGPSGVEIELSGGITLDRGPELAAIGADRISVGALTHSVQGIDFSLEL
jgi:nicotinate-nucleotide pyrophosphorylase (carboxylating)